MKNFDLEAAITTWKHFVKTERTISPEDADELEGHLRDHLDELLSEGVHQEAAFERAIREIGGQKELQKVYRAVYWDKVRAEHTLLDELRGRLELFASYARSALRSMRKRKSYTLINVLGLAIGLLCCSIIFLFVNSELSFDKFHENADRIVRIAEDLKTSDQMLYQDTSAPPMGPALVSDFPEVESMVRIRFASRLFRYNDNIFQENDLFYSDSTFFDIFSFELLQGNPSSALVAPFSIVLSKTTAEKYFQNEDPIGKSLVDEYGTAYTVTGVAADTPRNSHIRFDGLISNTSRNSWDADWETQWFANSYFTYLLLKPGTNRDQLQAKIPDFIESRIGELQRSIGSGYTQLPLIPFTEIHMSTHRSRGFGSNGRMIYIYIFGVIAFFILLIACLNFINLAIARSAERAKEVGLRKVVGAQRSQLTVQFLSESFLVTMAAWLLSLFFCWLIIPPLAGFISRPLEMSTLFQGNNGFVQLALLLVVSLLAGGYPAFILSGFRPIKILKGESYLGRQRAFFRKGMVVFQFAVSMILIVCTAVVVKQLNHLRSQELGFTNDPVMIVNFRGDNEVKNKSELIKQTFLDQPFVAAASMSRNVPGTGFGNIYSTVAVAPDESRSASLNYYMVDFDFAQTYELELLAGRSFSQQFPSDSLESIVINQSMVSNFGWASPEEALDKVFSTLGRDMKVIGVVKDFNYQSLHTHIKPLGMFVVPSSFQALSLRLEADQHPGAFARIKAIWEELVPHRPFEGYFMEDLMADQYEVEKIFASIFRFAAGFAILIACMGLFGLSAFTAQQRTKEIGVRKVLGASMRQILGMLSKDFARLLVIAFVVAVPIAYFAAEGWLSDFAYRSQLDPWIFIIAGLIASTIAILTISYQSVKAASINPVKAIQYE